MGRRNDMGGYLGLAAPTTYLDFAPYPFDLANDDIEKADLGGGDDPSKGQLIVDETFAVYEPTHPFGVRLFRPELSSDGSWACRVQIDSQIEVDANAIGRSGLEALWRALCRVGRELYVHPLWRAGKLGRLDGPGGYLGIQAPTSLIHLAPHPF